MASLTGTDGNGSGITPPTTFGVWGDSQTGDGVLGTTSTPTGSPGSPVPANSGVHGIYQQPSGLEPNIVPVAGCGVWGDSDGFPGVFGSSNGNYGVGGISTSGDGVYGAAFNPGTAGVRGYNSGTSDSFAAAAGVVGIGDCGVQAVGNSVGIQCDGNRVGLSVNAGTPGDPPPVGVQINAAGFADAVGLSVNATGVVAVGAQISAPDVDAAGATISAPNGFGALIYGLELGLMVSTPGTGFAAIFFGDVTVTGELHKSGGGFQIDHPLSPDSKIFNHSFVESSERKNIYDGVVKLDAKGAAIVKLPAWLEAVNGSFRYQLTSIGGPAPNLHVSKKISKGRFQIAGGKPRSEVSWQVTGVRTDPWAKANPLVVEEKKRANERGYYLDPLLYKKPEEKRILWKRHPQAAKRMNALEKQEAQPTGEVLKPRKKKPAPPSSTAGL